MAVSQLPDDVAIAHAHAVYVLQLLGMLKAPIQGRRPSDGELAFLLLALNDHIPAWPETSLPHLEQITGSVLFESLFNQTSDDALRFLVRTVDIIAGDTDGSPISPADWRLIQHEAFGCPYHEYVESFVAPLFILSRGWDDASPPIIAPAEWLRGPSASLYERWFAEATLSPDEDRTALSARPLANGLYRLPGLFFRKPFLRIDNRLVALSPWHVRDLASLGTWAKLNNAAKVVLATPSNQRFSATFGYLFEKWCAALAQEAAAQNPRVARVILPSRPGAADEIEDVVFTDDNLVALISAKASVVPEVALKGAQRLEDVIAWLKRFFFEDPAAAKGRGHRGGALYLLDDKIQRLRDGAYKNRGLNPSSVVLPAVICYGQIADIGGLYRWLEEECNGRGILSAKVGVRPVALLAPDDYESLLAIGANGTGVCRLLLKKSEATTKWQPMDAFLYREARGGSMRMPSMGRRFAEIVDASLARLRALGITGPGTTDRAEKVASR